MSLPKPTITVGIPSYNEEGNIAVLLRRILSQKRQFYRLNRIFVSCDGCSDNTVGIARSIAKDHPEVEVIQNRQRKGKNVRLNEMFSASDSDVFVVLDADTAVFSNTMLDELVKPFLDSKVGLVSASDRPLVQAGNFSKITTEVYALWFDIRKNLNKGDSVHNIHGLLYAMRKELYTVCRLPMNIHADDHYVYFRNKSLGYDFRFAQKAQVQYLLPNILKDYLVQQSRYLGGQDAISRCFGSWVDAYYVVPNSLKIRAIYGRFKKNPVLLLEAVGLQLLLRCMRPFVTQKRRVGTWKVISSTKLLRSSI